MLQSINPFTGKLTGSWNENNPDEIENILEESRRAFEFWRDTESDYRAETLLALADLLESRKQRLAEEMALEMGKPLTQGRSEIDKCAWVCRYYADNGASFLADEVIASGADYSYVCYQPLGVIYAVMPWNFPFWQFFRFAAPAVMAGNSFILKHSPNVTGCAMLIKDLFNDAGFPDSMPGVILISEENVSAVSRRIITDHRINAVTLTGSGKAGGSVAGAAGAAIKKCVLELGGSDPAIILQDADLELAAAECVFSRLINTGQNCIASKRFIVVENVYSKFLELFTAEMRARTMGDPMDTEVDIGPMARYDLRENLHRQVIESIRLGAELTVGGCIPDHPGAFYPPTVLTGCGKGMPVFDEETFGPVAAVCLVRDEREAIELANDTAFGLGASIYTRDINRGERIALGLAAGACFVNAFVRSDPRLPFGGIGLSGFGRELARSGMIEFTNCKTVYIKNS